MRIVLLHDVAKVGRKYEIKNVADGLARNMLLPKKLAVLATPANLALANKHAATVSQAKTEAEAQVAEAVQKLTDQKLIIKAKANETGHLFAAVHENDIAKALAEQGIVIPAGALTIPTPIKTVGENKIRLGEAEVTIEVEAKN